MALGKKITCLLVILMVFVFITSCVSNKYSRPFDYKKTQKLKKTHKDCGCPF